jgi:hypothetical protein
MRESLMSRRKRLKGSCETDEISRSGYEERIKSWLRSCNIPYRYETEVLKYTLPERKYIPDFIFTKKNGNLMYVEAKGILDSDTKCKMRAVRKQHPDKDIRILFQKNQPVRKGAKNKYSDWANQNNYLWAVGTELPKEWVKEIKLEDICVTGCSSKA